MFRKIYTAFLEILYGDTCIICRKNSPILCTQCLNKLSRNTLDTKNFIYPLFNYRDENVRKILWYIKYKHSPSLLKILTPFLCLYMDTHLPRDTYFLVPVPSRNSSNQKRGYVPTEVIAKELHFCNTNYIPIEKNTVLFKRKTKRQATLKDKNGRISNMHDAFLVKEDTVTGKNCIIIDDIITTGATTHSLRESLLKAGAVSVFIVTLAH